MVATGLRAQRSRAAAAAPTTPATPMLARVEPAALEVLAAAAEEELGEPPLKYIIRTPYLYEGSA